MSLRLLALAGVFTLALTATCSRTKPAVRVDGPAPRPDRGRVELIELQRELEATVLENYLQLGLGNMEAYADSIARSDEVTLIGVRPRDVAIGNPDDCPGRGSRAAVAEPARCGHSDDRLPLRRGDPCLGVSSAARPTATSEQPAAPVAERALAQDIACLGLFSKNMHTQMSQDREAAWVFDEISYRLPEDERQAAIPLRYTAVLVRELDRWVIAMEHLSYPLPNDIIIELARTGALAAPAPLAERPRPGLMPELHRHLMPEPQTRERLAAAYDRSRDAGEIHAERLLLLPDPNDEFWGRELYTSRTLTDIFGPETKLVDRDARVTLGPGGQVAWLAANLELRAVVGDEAITVGMRVTAVFELDEAKAWHLVQAHLSVPIGDEQLAQQALGPGLERFVPGSPGSSTQPESVALPAAPPRE
ncbi:nuclear transport factor 2 family protein [Haliangium sp.]|uniref:nuclear transport factor 2 family protein n=1 Tax=Haliangium sp. TaxID=2663208 RepID=UPI003D13CFEB